MHNKVEEVEGTAQRSQTFLRDTVKQSQKLHESGMNYISLPHPNLCSLSILKDIFISKIKF